MKKSILSCAVVLTLISLGFSCVMRSKQEERIRSKVVKLSNAHIQCSGIQIKAPSGQSYILTAGHCKDIADASGSMTVTTEDRKQLKRRILAEDGVSDLLLLEGLPGVVGLDTAAFSTRGEAIRTFTHGHGLDTYETDGVLIADETIKIPMEEISLKECEMLPKYKKENVDMFFGIRAEICVLEVKEAVTTALIIPGSSGGCVVNSSGNLVGIASATGNGLGYLVTIKDINNFLKGY